MPLGFVHGLILDLLRRHCERSEAIHSQSAAPYEWIASSLRSSQ
jgi:hypothetical protein